MGNQLTIRCHHCGKCPPSRARYGLPGRHDCACIRLDDLKKAQKEKGEAKSEAQKRLRTARRFNITVDKLKRLEQKANGRCRICGRDCDNLVMDHDHVSGAVRDLICRSCNVMLGFAMDSPATLEAGAAYLREHAEAIQAQMSA